MKAQKQWERNSAVFHARADEYDSWFEDSLLFDIEAAAVKALILPNRQPALEIGVGPGRFASSFSTDFGIDPAIAPLHISKKRGVTVCQAIGEALPFTSNSISRVSLFFTLCFVQNAGEVLAESNRVLQDTGHLLLGFVPATGPWGKDLQQKKEDGHPFYEHAIFFSVGQVETILKEQGFSVTNAVSSLYQTPGNVTQMEAPQPGIDQNAGFIVLRATKANGL